MLYKKDGKAFQIQGPNVLLQNTDLTSNAFENVQIENIDSLGDVSVDQNAKKVFQTVQELFENEAKKIDEAVEEKRKADPALFNILQLADTKEIDKEYEKMLRNPDGTPYSLSSSEVSVYDQTSPDLALIQGNFNELLARSGAPVEYYKIIIDSNVDDLYDEQRQKLMLQTPIILKAIYDPQVPSMSWMGGGFGDMGIITFTFSRNEFLEKSGELPRIGSAVRTLDDDTLWEVNKVNVNVQGDRMMWGKYMVAVECTKFQATAADELPNQHGAKDTGMRPLTII